METTSTVTLSPAAVGAYYRAIQEAYAIGGVDAVVREYGMLMAAAVIAAFVLVLLLLLVFLPRKRKVIRKRVVRVTRHAVPTAAPEDTDLMRADVSAEGSTDEPAKPRPRPARWLVPAVSLVVVIAAFVAAYVVTGSAAYCGLSCHYEDQRVGVAIENPHADCVECHESGAVSGGISRLRMALAYARSADALDAIPVPVSPTRCLRCHRDVALDTVVAVTGVRVSHKEALTSGRTCTDCHVDVGHRDRRSFAGGMVRCTVCHDGATASAECALCHPNGSPLEIKRTLGEPGSAFAYPTVQAANRDCSRCHGSNNRECLDCHNGFLLPHPQEFLEGGHGRVAAFDGRERCYKCHSIIWCGDGKCHNTFTPHNPEWLVEHRTGTSEKCGGCHLAWDHKGDWCDVCH